MHTNGKRNWLVSIALILLIVGGLNWGLVGAANFDLVATLLGAGSLGARIVYVLVGLSAIVVAIGSLMHAGHDHSTTTTASTDRPAPRPAVNRGL